MGNHRLHVVIGATGGTGSAVVRELAAPIGIERMRTNTLDRVIRQRAVWFREMRRYGGQAVTKR